MKNNNRKRARLVLFHYRCETCRTRFSLPTGKLSKDPYPHQSKIPMDENMILCVVCRKEQDKEFDIIFEDVE